MDNLSELNNWENVVAENVEKVEHTSKNLLDKSKQNPGSCGFNCGIQCQQISR